MSTASSPRSTTHSRSRTLARTLHARLFITACGRVFVARGKVSLAPLHGRIAGLTRAPTASEAPTPQELGIETCDGELTESTLRDMSCALAHWAKRLKAERRAAARDRERLAEIILEERENKRLESRLARSVQFRRELLRGAEPAGTPYFLDQDAERELRQIISEAEQAGPLPSLVAWHARLVFWLSGRQATSRFLMALAPILHSPDAAAKLRLARQFEQHLRQWKSRSHSERGNSLRAEMRHYLGKPPAGLVSEGNFTARLRSRNFAAHCDLLMERCGAYIERLQVQPWGSSAPGLAALAACDGGRAPLPRRLSEALSQSHFQSHLAQLLQPLFILSSQPGYDALLETLDKFPQLPLAHQFGEIRHFLVKGWRPEDVVWASEQGFLGSFYHSAVGPAWVRRTTGRFAKHGLALEYQDQWKLVEGLVRPAHVAAVESFLDWLRGIPRRALTPRVGQVLKSALRELILPTAGKLGDGSLLDAWFAGSHSLPSGAKAWLKRIGVYQRMAGLKDSLPQSIRKILPRENILKRESEFLRRQVGSGSASAAQHARLAHLATRERQAAHKLESRLIRAAEDAFPLVAIDALRALVCRGTREMWLTDIGTPLPELPVAKLVDYLEWLGKLNPGQRLMLREILGAWQQHGPLYKQGLSQNKRWLAKVEEHVDLAAWLHPAPLRTSLDGQAMQVSLAESPWEIFSMGDYFGTCLSLGSCYQHSILANAYDANKQVVYMVAGEGTERRRVVARQLIAQTADYKLLGYHCYVNYENSRKELREACLVAMSSFCGRLARQCGLALADEGEPDKIGRTYWYDDGVWKWHAAAHEAWHVEDERRRGEATCEVNTASYECHCLKDAANSLAN